MRRFLVRQPLNSTPARPFEGLGAVCPERKAIEVSKDLVASNETDPDGLCYTVRSRAGRVVMVLSGLEAADAAVDWVDKGYEVDETTCRDLAVAPEVRWQASVLSMTP